MSPPRGRETEYSVAHLLPCEGLTRGLLHTFDGASLCGSLPLLIPRASEKIKSKEMLKTCYTLSQMEIDRDVIFNTSFLR